ncbi:MAG TPA: hypothetical protein VF242_14550 [Nitrososphaeraceae archaeon]
MSSPANDNIANKDKIKNLKINTDEIDRIVSKKNIIHKKIQLWTNDKGNEYAISLLLDDSDPSIKNISPFIASTNPNEEYTHPIAETDSIQTLEHGWNYALRELIEEYKENRFQKVIREGFQSIKLIPFYKCTYCNKEFSSEEEQNKHEHEWHI